FQIVSVPGLADVSDALGDDNVMALPPGPISARSASVKLDAFTGMLKVICAEDRPALSSTAVGVTDVTARPRTRNVPTKTSPAGASPGSRNGLATAGGRLWFWFIWLPARSRTSGPTRSVYVPGRCCFGKVRFQTVSMPGLALVSVMPAAGTTAPVGSRSSTSGTVKLAGLTGMLNVMVAEETPTESSTGAAGVMPVTARPSPGKWSSNGRRAGPMADWPKVPLLFWSISSPSVSATCGPIWSEYTPATVGAGKFSRKMVFTPGLVFVSDTPASGLPTPSVSRMVLPFGSSSVKSARLSGAGLSGPLNVPRAGAVVADVRIGLMPVTLVTARPWMMNVPENWSPASPKALLWFWFIKLPATSLTSGPTLRV